MDNLRSILQHSASTKVVLDYITNPSTNLLDANQFQFNDIYWLLKDKAFYSEMINCCRQRGLYDVCVWKYAFKHQDKEAMLEYIKEQDNFGFKQPYMHTSLLSYDNFQLHEFDPLVN